MLDKSGNKTNDGRLIVVAYPRDKRQSSVNYLIKTGRISDIRLNVS